MLLDISKRRILGRFIPEPLPPLGSFNGQTVLITGGTTGLGLAAATHFATLGADVVITCRDESRGETARKLIERRAQVEGKNKVKVMKLDLNTYASCLSFMEQLKSHMISPGQLDVAVLNAGIINSDFAESPEGWEQTIQVNALSTIFIALLLLAWMKEGRQYRRNAAHLIFGSSRDHLYPNINLWAKWADQGGVLHHLSQKQNWPPHWKTTEPNYANSKLALMYGIVEICKLALGPDDEPQVIVNSVCPGIVNSDIGRVIAGRSWLMRYGVPLYMHILGKSTDSGARIYVRAARTSAGEHGKFSMIWLSDEEYQKRSMKNMRSKNAIKLQSLVWREMVDDFARKLVEVDQYFLALANRYLD